MASKRRLRRKSCDGKVGHETFGAAFVAAKRTHGSGLVPYRCRFCGKFHVGHRIGLLKNLKPAESAQKI